MSRKNISLLSGIVIPGAGRGQKLGFPTANLKLTSSLDRPADGIYACLAQINSTSPYYLAVLHAGPRPTFPDAQTTIEVHLIDFPYQELYGKKLQITNLSRIRSIVKYPSSADLVQAIKQDIKRAKILLKNNL